MYYADKADSLKDIFGTTRLSVDRDSLNVNGVRYPIVDDVIILVGEEKMTDYARGRVSSLRGGADDNVGAPLVGALNRAGIKPAPTRNDGVAFARDIQYSFGEEWSSYHSILPEHRNEFSRYFDLVSLDLLKGLRLCDLGCGSGRWSYFLKEIAREILLVDFSDAIFTARRNLAGAGNCLFFMCDLKELPFRDGFADFLFSLGVLHHLPTPCLDEVRKLKRAAGSLLIYLYYDLDNRPSYFKFLLRPVTFARMKLSKVRSRSFREAFSLLVALIVYMPLVITGRLLDLAKLGRFIPLYEGYKGKSIGRIRQDAYDRFFTRIEQRVSRKEIEGLKDTFASIKISDNPPYWHFLCKS